MLSKKHLFSRIFISFIVCFYWIEKGRCQTTPATGCINDPNYCQNAGSCVDGVCDCKSGFTGDKCQTLECTDSNPATCQNGGVCVTPEEFLESGMICSCVTGFTGAYCEEGCINDPSYCQNEGSCVDGVCECKVGFTGDKCDMFACTDSNPVTCQNGGVCAAPEVFAEVGIICECIPGFTGTYCEQATGCINDPSYCQNAGECIDGVCQCNFGFTGDECEIIECSSSTCQNGGFCLTEATSDPSLLCQCSTGFTGTFCEEVDLAEMCMLTCANGNCSLNHTCECNPGFKGTYCDELITCMDEPCQNGGVCVVEEPQRRKRQSLEPTSDTGCSCPLPYTGSFCEVEIPPCDIDCKNNGQCTLNAEALTYYCECLFGYSGDYCENVDHCGEIGCDAGGYCDEEGSCVCPDGRYGGFCEYDVCETGPCENGGLCILPINEYFYESEITISTNEFECACPPGFRGSTCAGVIVECGRNEFACTSGECIPLSKKCDNVPYDCADNSDEQDGECNNEDCGDLLSDLDSMTERCGEISDLFSSFAEVGNQDNIRQFYSVSDFPEAANVIFKISIDVTPYMGIDILSDGTLFVALLSESEIETLVFYIKISYQNGDGQTRFEKNLTDIYSIDPNGQLVSLSFLPDGSTNQISLSYFECSSQETTCLTLSIRNFFSDCNDNNCIERYADWRQASDQKRDLNCGVTSIDTVVDPLYEQCLIPPFITSISGNMDIGIEETVSLYCVAFGVPTPTLQWVEITEAGESIYIGESFKEQAVYELSDILSTTRFACLAVNIVDELLSEDIVISPEDSVCTDLQASSQAFSVSNPACYNETLQSISASEGQFGGFTYIVEFTEGFVLYSASFSSSNIFVGGGESSSPSSSEAQFDFVVLSIQAVISNVITGAVIYSQVFDGIIITLNLEGSSRIDFSFDQPIKINSTSRYEIALSISDPAYQLSDEPLDVNGVTCVKGPQECRQFINDWNGLISDQIDAGCDDIDAQYTAAELCFGEFFGDPEVIRHPESQVNDFGLTSTLECNIENVEFYEWYKNGDFIPSSGPTYSLLLDEGQDQGDYACVGSRSQDLKDAMSNTATVLITGLSTFRVVVRFNIPYETAYTDQESETFKNFTSALQKSLEDELPPFELYVTDLQSGSVITEMELYFSDQTQNASTYSMMINDSLVSLSEYQTDPSSIVVTSISTCIGEDVTEDGILYTFTDVPLGITAESIQNCPLYSDQGTTVPLATRYCGGDFVSGAEWGPIIVLDCDIGTTSTQIQRINEVEVTEDNAGDVADALASVTSNTADLDEDSIMTVSVILEDIVGLEMADESITLDVVEVVDNVIESGVLGTDQSMRETASSFVTSLERQLATVAAAGMNFTSVLPHVSVMTLAVSSDALENGLAYVAFSDGDSLKDNFEPDDVKTFFEKTFPIDIVAASIALPPEVISINQAQTGEDEIRVYFTVYQNSSLFISNKLANESGEDFTRQVGSHVISASIEAVKIDGLVYPIKAAFLPRFETTNNTECVFWDFSLDDGVGEWSNEGCTYNGTEDDRAICSCDHLTNFAILVDYYEPKESTFQDVLTIISLIGCIVSIVCLAITIATYLYFKQFRSKRPQRILINLSISLLLLYLVFAIGIEKTSSKSGCIAVAALIHYFGLASVFWMSIEAINMYLMFVKVFYDDIRYFMLKVCALGYGTPLVIVAICLGIEVDNYANENYCFIPSGNVRNFGFILVIGVLLLFNCIVFVLVMRTLTCGRKVAKTIDQSKREQVIKRLQNAIAVSVLLGLTWVFGFLAIDSDSSARDVFQALFCIFNSLQGLFIFLLFCVRQKEIRDAWKGCCKESDRAKRVKYATDTSNKGKVKDHSIPLTNDGTRSTNTKSNERV